MSSPPSAPGARSVFGLAPLVASSASDLSNRELEDGLTELAAHIHAAEARFLVLLAELDRRRAWAVWGVASAAHWLSWKCGIGLVAAREKVRVARSLEVLPRIAEAFRRGELSYSKVRAVTRIATRGSEDYLLHIARTGTASHVEKLVRQERRRQALDAPDEARRAHLERGVRYRWEDGCLVLEARLPAESGELVLKALEAAVGMALEDERRERRSDDSAESSPGSPASTQASTPASTPASSPAAGDGGDPPGGDSAEASGGSPKDTADGAAHGRSETPGARRADALVAVAECFLASSRKGDVPRLPGGERTMVILHADLAGLRELEDAGPVAPSTARRLSCDASRVEVASQPLSVGRRSRTLPAAVRRALHLRDRHCRFPGCNRRSGVEGHHIVHWARGGETSLRNLVVLCRQHHWMVHEGGFSLAHDASGRPAFARPDGTPIPEVHRRRPFHGDAAKRLATANGRAGLSIDAATGRPSWRGEAMDYSIALGTLAAIGRREAGAARGHPS